MASPSFVLLLQNYFGYSSKLALPYDEYSSASQFPYVHTKTKNIVPYVSLAFTILMLIKIDNFHNIETSHL